jgi:hypothetical protein
VSPLPAAAVLQLRSQFAPSAQREENTLQLSGVSIWLLAGLGFQKHHNQEGRNNRNRCGKVDTGIVVSVQNTVLYVKPTQVFVKGMAIKHVVGTIPTSEP